MTCNPLNTANPYLWLFLAGFFLGLGLGRMPFLYSRRHPRRMLGSGGWVFLSLFFSLGVLSFLASFFAAGGLFSGIPVSLEYFYQPGWTVLMAAALVLGGLSSRFPLGAGIPVVLLFVVMVFAGILALKSWYCLQPGEPVIQLKILAERKNPDTGSWISVVQAELPGGASLMTTLEGRGFTPVIEQIFAPRVLFLMGSGSLYRVPALHGADVSPGFAGPEGSGGEIPLGTPAGNFLSQKDLLPKIAEKIPFIEYTREYPGETPPGIGQTIKVRLDGRGGMSVEQVYF